MKKPGSRGTTNRDSATVNVRSAKAPVIAKQYVQKQINLFGPAPEASPALEDYRRHVARFCEISDGLRFLPTRDTDAKSCQPLRLAEVYVPLDVKPDEAPDADGLAKFKAARRRMQSDRATPEPALKRLSESNRLVLLGLPGSGKSTFLKPLCLCLAQHALEPKAGWLRHLEVSYRLRERDLTFAWPRPLAGRLPVFVELRKFADELAQSPSARCPGPHHAWLVGVARPGGNEPPRLPRCAEPAGL